MADGDDGWTASAAYEDFMGRWSRTLAPLFLSGLGVPRGVPWLDVGCGTGALTFAICAHADPASVTGCDPAVPFVEYARERCDDARASFVVAGVGALPVRSSGYGAVCSLLALNFFPDPQAAVREMTSLAADGGVIAACVWDYAGEMEMLRRFWDAVVELDPSAAALDEGVRFPICRPSALLELFRGSALRDVSVTPIAVPTTFASFEDFWTPLLGGTGPAPSYVATLAGDRREALARTLDTRLPRGPDGSIPLVARAWAVRGIAPP